MRTITIIVIVVTLLVILIRDHICFTNDTDDTDEDERDCYHTGDW